MRPVPEYPPYGDARPPGTARWLSASALLVLLSGGVSALLASSEGKSALAATGILLALVLAGTGWLIRLLYYRMSVHNAKFYDQLVAYEQQQWWAEHRQPIGLQEGLLLGPMGKTTTDWLRVLSVTSVRQRKRTRAAAGRCERHTFQFLRLSPAKNGWRNYW